MANVTFESANTTLYAYLAGEIDHDSSQLLRLAIDAQLDMRMPETLVMDFSGVGFMDSSGVGLILGRLRRIQASGGKLQIRRPPAQIEKILNIAQIEVMEAEG
jgi:stage II sporulation protein AA (anti-sigma F factor antagonist)